MLPLVLFLMLLGSHVAHAMERPTKKQRSLIAGHMEDIKLHNARVSIRCMIESMHAQAKQDGLDQELLEISHRNTHEATYRMRQLLAAGANTDVHAFNVTPLIMACQTGNEERVRALLDAGANPNGLDPSMTPLHAAVKMKTEEGKEYRFNIIRLLITKGAHKTTGAELTPLRHAVEHNDIEACEAIIYTPSTTNALLPINQGIDTEIEELKQQFNAKHNGTSLYACAQGQGYRVSDLIRYKKLIEIRGNLKTYWNIIYPQRQDSLGEYSLHGAK